MRIFGVCTFLGLLAMAAAQDCESTGHNCVPDCVGVADGDYQSCRGCNVYISCSGGITYDNRPCATGSLRWDDNTKRCEYNSPTCTGCVSAEGDSDGSNCLYSGPACITSCANKADGDYQSCHGCNVYASCSEGWIHDKRSCGATFLKWDDTLKVCTYKSTTCKCCNRE